MKDFTNDSACKLDDETMMNFFRCITLCHETSIFELKGDKHFSGSSQDDIVLLQSLKDSGIIIY